MIISRFISLFSLILLGSASACAHYGQAEGEQLQNEVFALQTQVTSMQKTIVDLRTTNAKLAQEVGELTQAAGRNSADLGAELETTREKVARMLGRVESFSERVTQLEAAASKAQEELEIVIKQFSIERDGLRQKSDDDRKKAVEAARVRERLLSDANKALDHVKSLIATNPAEAREIVRELSIRYKGDKKFKSKFGARAQFLLGESYFEEKAYQAATAEYNIVRKEFASSKTFVPKALYKMGLCFESLGLKDDARLFYQSVVEKYGRSSTAKKAKQRLKSL